MKAAASLEAPSVIVVGGSSGMGKAAALEVLRQGGRVLLCSRSEEKLLDAKRFILNTIPGGKVDICALNAMDEAAVEAFSESLETQVWDGLIISSAGPAVHGPMASLATSDARYMMETKFWSAYNCAKYISPKLRDGGAVVFVAGILNRRPGVNCSPLAIANGALEALTRSLALEWGPRLRVNCLSPGFCDTERFSKMDQEKRRSMLENTAASLPLRRVGLPDDMGKALHYLVSASFVTGVVLDVDGGHMIRQYANAANDPMRTANKN